MKIPKMKNYLHGEYSLIQIAPTIDSQELINIGVIVKDLKENISKIELFDNMKKLLSRVHIENINSLEYALSILKKSIEKNNSDFSYKNFTNSIKINRPIPISITEATIEEQVKKLYKEKVTLLKTFPMDSSNSANVVYDKNYIIDKMNVFIRSEELGNILKTRKKLNTQLGATKQVDAVGFDENNKPLIVSDIISPATSHIDDMYAKSLFTLKHLMDETIQEKIFYIPQMDGVSEKVLNQLKYIKEDIQNEQDITLNDSHDQKEFIESMAEKIKRYSA